MLIDTTLLRVMKYKKDYYALVDSIPFAAVDEKTSDLIADFGKYFRKFPDHKVIDMDLFIPRFRKWRKGMKKERFQLYKKILATVREDADESARTGILEELHEHELAMRLANLCTEYEEGDLKVPLLDAVSVHMDKFRSGVGKKALLWDETPESELFSKEAEEGGIRWRLDCLNECMRGLQPGDFGIIAARPDQGKTTFLVSEMTYMAPQLPEDRDILWFNNEGLASTIRKRLYNAALGMTTKDLVDLVQTKGDKVLIKRYVKRVGRRDRIKVMNAHGMTAHQIEAIIEQSKPGIVLFDMLDNVKGFGTEARTDLQLEALYQWARERAVKYNCIVMATSQISVEGENTQYPALSMLKDSKTGKQGACDFQLMIGSIEAEHMKDVRFISLPKNKLRKDGAKSDPRCEVKFLAMIARYADIDGGT